MWKENRLIASNSSRFITSTFFDFFWVLAALRIPLSEGKWWRERGENKGEEVDWLTTFTLGKETDWLEEPLSVPLSVSDLSLIQLSKQRRRDDEFTRLNERGEENESETSFSDVI